MLGEHHRRLAALLQAGGLAGDRGPDELADALTGFYLSRRLAGARLEGWAPAAIQTIIGAAGNIPPRKLASMFKPCFTREEISHLLVGR